MNSSPFPLIIPLIICPQSPRGLLEKRSPPASCPNRCRAATASAMAAGGPGPELGFHRGAQPCSKGVGDSPRWPPALLPEAGIPLPLVSSCSFQTMPVSGMPPRQRSPSAAPSPTTPKQGPTARVGENEKNPEFWLAEKSFSEIKTNNQNF